METPKYLPARKPDITTKENIIEYRPIPGITFHKEDDGIIYYYDRPIMFIAFIEGRQVIVTLLDDDMNYPEEPRRGWEQCIAIEIDDGLLHDIYESRKVVRDYWRGNVPNWFIYEKWVYKGDQVWEHEYEIWQNVTILDSWKASDGVYLDGKKIEENKSWIRKLSTIITTKLTNLRNKLLKSFTT